MKKTLITMLALAGVALGGDWTYQSTGKTSSASADSTSGGSYNGITFTITNDSDRATWEATDVDYSDALSLTLDTIAVSGRNGNTSFSYSVSDGESEITKHFAMIVVDNTGKLITSSTSAATQSQKPITGIDYTRNYGVFNFDNATILTGEQYFAYFVTQENLDIILETEDFTLTSSNFGTYTSSVELFAYKGNNATDFAYSSPSEDNSFSTSIGGEKDTSWIPAMQVKGTYTAAPEVTPSVPEPTTATLSLLARAGLAARRRRK